METALGWARAYDFGTLELETNPNQHGMQIYQKLGFVSVGYASDGDEIMRLTLK